MTTEKTIQSVVEEGLCTQCGWCVMLCPTAAIEQRETPAGYLLPKILSNRCTECGLCRHCCSGWHINDGLLDDRSDLLQGPILAAFIGSATDQDIRSRAQSGGIVSALLCHQLECGDINAAIVTKMPADGSLRPYACIAETREQILRTRGSQYCPVSFDPALSALFHAANQTAIVGTSCQLQTLANSSARTGKQIALTIGLFCDGILCYSAIEDLLASAGVEREDATCLRYKDRCHGDFPGDVRIDRRELPSVYLSNRMRLRIKRPYTPVRCRLCFDKLNVLADISVGDTWGIASSKEGLSAVLVRTSKGLAAVDAAIHDGVVSLDPVDPQKIIRGQQVDKRRREWIAYRRAWEHLGRTPPMLNATVDESKSAKRRDILAKTEELRRAERLAGQPTREATLKEVRRQLVMQSLKYALDGSWFRRFAARRLKMLKDMIARRQWLT